MDILQNKMGTVEIKRDTRKQKKIFVKRQREIICTSNSKRQRRRQSGDQTDVCMPPDFFRTALFTQWSVSWISTSSFSSSSSRHSVYNPAKISKRITFESYSFGYQIETQCGITCKNKHLSCRLQMNEINVDQY